MGNGRNDLFRGRRGGENVPVSTLWDLLKSGL